MLGDRLRDILIDALGDGPPYKISTTRQAIPDAIYLELLKELERRGLITSGQDQVLTDDGIAEAKWFAGRADRGEDESPPERQSGDVL